jgi:hypothetical protein
MLKKLKVIASQEFTQDQLNKLRDSFKKIETIDPESETYLKLRKKIEDMSPETLKQIISAKIKFLSSLALNTAIRKGIKI